MMNAESSRAVILVVDDEPIVRMSVACELEACGFDVLEAESADEALTTLEAHDEVRALFTDINMPGRCDGLELAHAVHRRWPNVQLVITSGRVRPTQAEIPDDGRFIPKPYSPEMVSHLMVQLLH